MSVCFELDISKCSACGACAMACMDQNDIDIAAGERPFRRVFRAEERVDGQGGYFRAISYYSAACMHCEDAPCVMACPSRCLSKDAETGLTIYDNASCVGCHSCAMACPFGAPAFSADGKMQKCDGCIERIRHGLTPACARVCPTGALRFEPGSEAAVKSLKRVGEEILATSY